MLSAPAPGDLRQLVRASEPKEVNEVVGALKGIRSKPTAHHQRSEVQAPPAPAPSPPASFTLDNLLNLPSVSTKATVITSPPPAPSSTSAPPPQPQPPYAFLLWSASAPFPGPAPISVPTATLLHTDPSLPTIYLPQSLSGAALTFLSLTPPSSTPVSTTAPITFLSPPPPSPSLLGARLDPSASPPRLFVAVGAPQKGKGLLSLSTAKPFDVAVGYVELAEREAAPDKPAASATDAKLDKVLELLGSFSARIDKIEKHLDI
ncbi:hypothetical protein TeGR_g12306 [Tetraparma gracilis]|uniref:Uncharacterized protein n=1 Tax=Tetraparma gracilis TaxID=2962635 RepID=A0ABQ6M8J4_9STRA|nr:hypothetical protein TeGR_g12306 [Tetraparma gracilis]